MTVWVLRRVAVIMAQAVILFVLIVGLLGGLWR